jgi:hypothetical protein
MLTLTWQDHNRLLQADQVVAYDDGDTGREDGQQTIVEWRFGASSTGPWGAPTISTVTAPQTASYDPPGDGWVQITCYTIRDGLVSWQAHVGVLQVVGGGLFDPTPYEDEDGDLYVDQDANIYEG